MTELRPDLGRQAVCPDPNSQAVLQLPNQTRQACGGNRKVVTASGRRADWDAVGNGFLKLPIGSARKKSEQLYGVLANAGTLDDTTDDRVGGLYVAMETLHGSRTPELSSRQKQERFHRSYTRLLSGLDVRQPGVQLAPQRELRRSGPHPDLAAAMIRFTAGDHFYRDNPHYKARRVVDPTSEQWGATAIIDNRKVVNTQVAAKAADITLRVPTGLLQADDIGRLDQFRRDGILELTPTFVNLQALRQGESHLDQQLEFGLPDRRGSGYVDRFVRSQSS